MPSTALAVREVALRQYPRFSDKLIEEAFRELDKFEDALSRESALSVILCALVHGEPELVRTQLSSITQPWPRYELLIELYGAFGEERDLVSIRSVDPDEHFPEPGEIKAQIDELRIRIATGWRSEPMQRVMTSSYRVKMLARSNKRLEQFSRMSAPDIFLFNEMCLRIALGEASSIAKARALASDAEMRDNIVAAVAKAHAHSGSPIRARKALQHVALPMHRIEVLTVVACVESELGIKPVVESAQHH